MEADVFIAITITDLVLAISKVVSPNYIGTVFVRWKRDDFRDYIVMERGIDEGAIQSALTLLHVNSFAKPKALDSTIYGLRHLRSTVGTKGRQRSDLPYEQVGLDGGSQTKHWSRW